MNISCTAEHGIWRRWLKFERIILALILISFANQFALLFTLTEEGMGLKFAFRPIPLGYGVRGKYIAICDMLIAVLFVFWLIASIISGQLKQTKWRNYPLCLLLLFGVGAASAFNSHSVWGALFDKLSQFGLSPKGIIKAMLLAEPFREAATELVQWALYLFVLPLLAMALLQRTDDDDKKSLLDLMLILTLIVEAFALYDYVVHEDPSHVSGLFGSRNIYSGYLALMLPLLLARAIHGGTIRLSLCMLAIVIGMFTSLSGWCWLALVGGLFAVALFYLRRGVWTWAICITAFLCISYALQTRFYREALPHLLDPYDDEWDVRKEYIEWQAALNSISQDAPPPRSNFLLGVGIGGYQINIDAYYGSLPNKEKMPLDSNSLYLVIGTTLGFIGIATLMFILLHNGALAFELRRRSEDVFAKAFAVGMIGAIVSLAISSIFTNLFVRGTGPLIVLLITLLHVMREGIRTNG